MSEDLSYKRDHLKANPPIWCPGCGDFAILDSVATAFAELLNDPQSPVQDPAQIVYVSGIGCSGQTGAYLGVNGFHTIHGRVLPTAQAIKAVRPDLVVVGGGGDGDGYGIGGGHISHAAARNMDLTYIIYDNQIYSLTKRQASPTTPAGLKTKTTPYGNIQDPLNPLAMFLAYDVSFIAQGGAGSGPEDSKQLVELIKAAILHPGFSIVRTRQLCPVFMPQFDREYLNARSRPVPPLQDEEAQIYQRLLSKRDIPSEDMPRMLQKLHAFSLALDQETVYMGVLYQDPRPTRDVRLAESHTHITPVTLAELGQKFQY